MKPVAWLIGAAAVSWVVVSEASGGRANPEALYGMMGPLAAAVVSWVGYERVHRSAPERLMSAMIVALALKMVFFGAYVVGMVQVVGLRPVPFVVSVAAYFIGLHAMEALFLKRMLGQA